MKYCKKCSEDIFKDWRGWPLLKDIGNLSETVPDLPKLDDGCSCQVCGGNASIDSEDIRWRSCNSKFSTGLPDYWVLSINYREKDWGRPYAYEASCLSCLNTGVVSYIKYPDGSSEWAINCVKCGLIKSKSPFENLESGK